MDGEENQQQETVLSQEEAPKTEASTEVQQQDQQPPKNDDPDIKRHNFQNMTRRLENKAWRGRLSLLEQGVSDDEIHAAVKESMSEMGFDPNDKDNEKNAMVLAKVQAKMERLKIGRLQGSRRENAKVASTALTETFKVLGVNPTSSEGKTLGQHLFNKFDVDDPDIFRDKDLIEKEIEEFASSIGRKKKDPVQNEIVRKAGAPVRTTESRTVSVGAQKTSEAKSYADSHGISIAKAEKILARHKDLPKHMR